MNDMNVPLIPTNLNNNAQNKPEENNKKTKVALRI